MVPHYLSNTNRNDKFTSHCDSCTFSGKIMMELGLLFAITIMALAGIYGMLVRSLEGTKGITKPYRTKSGRLRTAKKSRERYIV